MIDSQELINAIFAYNWVNYIFSWKTLVCMVILALLGAAILGEEFLDDIEKIEAEETSRVKFILSTGLFVSFYILSVITTSTMFSSKKIAEIEAVSSTILTEPQQKIFVKKLKEQAANIKTTKKIGFDINDIALSLSDVMVVIDNANWELVERKVDNSENNNEKIK